MNQSLSVIPASPSPITDGHSSVDDSHPRTLLTSIHLLQCSPHTLKSSFDKLQLPPYM